MVIEAVRNVGEATEVFSSRSSPTASIPCNMRSSVEEMVTSLTGNASFPPSIQNPEAPREKSPVMGLNPNPIISVTYKPRSTEAMISARGVVPASRMKLLVEGAIDPPERAALAVDSRPSLRAL